MKELSLSLSSSATNSTFHHVFPKYVSLDHMWHCRIGLSKAGNDFFVPLSVLRGIAVVLVIRPFITLPARHSAVWVNAISPDSHNYPKIERGREICLTVVLWVRESLWKYTEKETLTTSFFLNSSGICCLDPQNRILNILVLK